MFHEVLQEDAVMPKEDGCVAKLGRCSKPTVLQEIERSVVLCITFRSSISFSIWYTLYTLKQDVTDAVQLLGSDLDMPAKHAVQCASKLAACPSTMASLASMKASQLLPDRCLPLGLTSSDADGQQAAEGPAASALDICLQFMQGLVQIHHAFAEQPIVTSLPSQADDVTAAPVADRKAADGSRDTPAAEPASSNTLQDAMPALMCTATQAVRGLLLVTKLLELMHPLECAHPKTLVHDALLSTSARLQRMVWHESAVDANEKHLADQPPDLPLLVKQLMAPATSNFLQALSMNRRGLAWMRNVLNAQRTVISMFEAPVCIASLAVEAFCKEGKIAQHIKCSDLLCWHCSCSTVNLGCMS